MGFLIALFLVIVAIYIGVVALIIAGLRYIGFLGADDE